MFRQNSYNFNHIVVEAAKDGEKVIESEGGSEKKGKLMARLKILFMKIRSFFLLESLDRSF